MGVQYRYQVPAGLLKAAATPIGVLSVRIGLMEVAKTSVTDEGLAVILLPDEIYQKITVKELVVRTLHYRLDESPGASRKVKIVCLCLVQAPGRFRSP